MRVTTTAILDMLVIDPDVFGEKRGFLFESFNQVKFETVIGRKVNFVQNNHSISVRSVLRGLHCQIQQPQTKLVRVLEGEVSDVVVDIHKSSPAFSKWLGEIFLAENKNQLRVSDCFVVLSDATEFLYKTTDYYAPEYESDIVWNDSAINIQWSIQGEPALSAKDRQAKSLAVAECFA